MKTHRNRSHAASLGITMVLALTGFGRAQEHVGQVQQPLVGGSMVDSYTQEQWGLVTLNFAGGGYCSGSLLREDWNVTAAHCVEPGGANNKQTPDPARPGQNMLFPPSSVKVSAVWGGGQNRQATRIETFRPYD